MMIIIIIIIVVVVKTNILKKPKINKPHPNQLLSSFLLRLSGM